MSTARLSIVSANPDLTVSDIQAIFVREKLLSDELIKGHAYVAGKEIRGTFSFAEEQYMQEGESECEVVFRPLDDKNVNVARTTVSVKTESVDLFSFDFDPLENFDMLGYDGSTCRARIGGPVRMTLRPVLDELELLLNGYVVPYVNLSKTDRLNIAVRLGEDVALSFLLDVTLETGEAPVVLGESLLDFGTATHANATITVPEGGIRISLAESAKTEYNLYVDGILTDNYVLYGEEGSVVVSVRQKSDGKAVFSRIYTVKKEEPMTEQTINYALYFGIGGGVLGLAAVIAVVLIIWRKKNG